ncbi:MAG TPA: hypothetical protein VMT16_10555, partial [Thermoanaerobaculia bacterium]|nr:hypothetical protein [Thermoanaerobaculia bacterium]
GARQAPAGWGDQLLEGLLGKVGKDPAAITADDLLGAFLQLGLADPKGDPGVMGALESLAGSLRELGGRLAAGAEGAAGETARQQKEMQQILAQIMDGKNNLVGAMLEMLQKQSGPA